MTRRIDCEIDDDRLSIGLTVDPEALDPASLADELAPAIARALEAWRDGQAAAIGHEAERRAAWERRIWRVDVDGAGRSGR